MHISYKGKTGKFSIEEIEKSLLQEMIQLLDKSVTTQALRSGLCDIRDDVEAMGVATLDEDNEYVWSIPLKEEDMPF